MEDRLAADTGHEISDVRFAARPAHDHGLEVLRAALADEAEVGAFDRVHAGHLYSIDDGERPFDGAALFQVIASRAAAAKEG